MFALTAWLALAVASPDGSLIQIGNVTSLSAGSVEMGQALVNGARLAEEELNGGGGVLGKKLALIDLDDASNTEIGLKRLTELLDKKKIVALLGPLNTGVGKAAVRLANQRQIPLIVTANTACEVNELFREFPENYAFRLAASDALQTRMVVNEALAARGKKKMAILHDETAYGTENRDRIKALLSGEGVQAAYVGEFKLGQTDMAPLVQAARTAGADVVVLWGRGGEAAAVARAMEKAAWRVDLLGSWQLSNPLFLKRAGPYGEGAVMPQTFIEAGAKEPLHLKFIAAYRKRFNVAKVEAASAAAQSYDAVHLLARALKQAGSTEGPKVRAALEKLRVNYEGVTGQYDCPWTRDDHEGITPAQVVWGRVKSGVVVAD